MSWHRAVRVSPLRVLLAKIDPSSETPRQARLSCRQELRRDWRACWGHVLLDDRRSMMSVCRWLASRQTRRGHRPGKNAGRPSEKNWGCRFGRCGACHRRNPPAPVQEAPMSAKRWNRRGGGAVMRCLSFQPQNPMPARASLAHLRPLGCGQKRAMGCVVCAADSA
jgi:hypothetical protein